MTRRPCVPSAGSQTRAGWARNRWLVVDYPGAKFPKVQRVTAAEFVKEMRKTERRGKFNIPKTDPQDRFCDGYVFDSGLEKVRYLDLKLLLAAGQIRDLEVHPQLYLDVNGERVGYKPDFGYWDVRLDQKVYEECKGNATDRGERWRVIQKLWRGVGPCRLKVIKGTKRGYAEVRVIYPGKREAK